ncbi:hypothetical protein ACFFK0_26585 [Paenibacillus chartarius]|uniref:Uncharacterized protein n=1 Tax=Paenibacillus chartarius TaxID=747481 RepID=A0ABV6DTH8_9BACL
MFHGKIHFTNLYEDELGLLLWALMQEDHCYHQIGMGKPYGYGRVRVDAVKVEVYKLDQWYDTFDFEEGRSAYAEEIDAGSLITRYKDTVKARDGIDLSQANNVKEWMAMKSVLLPDDVIRYMELKKKEFTHMLKNQTPLPGVEELIALAKSEADADADDDDASSPGK